MHLVRQFDLLLGFEWEFRLFSERTVAYSVGRSHRLGKTSTSAISLGYTDGTRFAGAPSCSCVSLQRQLPNNTAANLHRSFRLRSVSVRSLASATSRIVAVIRLRVSVPVCRCK